MNPDQIRQLRKELDLTQQQFAERLGVSFVTLNRWENGQSKPSAMGLTKLRELRAQHERTFVTAQGTTDSLHQAEVQADATKLDFLGDAKALRVLVEGERLSYGHLFNPAFATEISEIDPLPHQRIAVYQRMLPQSRLRFLLADDAGAGKTIMTGLYVASVCLAAQSGACWWLPQQAWWATGTASCTSCSSFNSRSSSAPTRGTATPSWAPTATSWW